MTIKNCFLPVLIFLLHFQAYSQTSKPNFIIFIADDVSWNDFGCYGNTAVSTPNIDRIASRGMICTNAFLTTSSCSPSRNSIMTGRYPHNTGGAELHSDPPDEMVAFPELLRNNGYYCVSSGKFHMGPYARRAFDKIYERGVDIGDGGEEKWVQSLKERPSDKPFFMWFAALDAHRVWGENRFSGAHDPNKITPPPYMTDGEETRLDLAKYYDEIKRFDHYIGEVEAVLEEQGVADHTFILIMADNGRPFLRCKTRMYDSGMKTPFVIKWPQIGSEPTVCHSLISAVDIAPTILDLADVPVPETIQGRSFQSILVNPEAPFRNYAFAEHNWHDFEAHERMVRTPDFLYILNSRPQFPNQGPLDVVNSASYKELLEIREKGRLTAAQTDVFATPRPAEELYDCNRDEMQLINIAALPEYGETLLRLRYTLNNWMTETGDEIPEQLTKDWYDRITGMKVEEGHGIRGEMPGNSSGAVSNKSKGDF